MWICTAKNKKCLKKAAIFVDSQHIYIQVASLKITNNWLAVLWKECNADVAPDMSGKQGCCAKKLVWERRSHTK